MRFSLLQKEAGSMYRYNAFNYALPVAPRLPILDDGNTACWYTFCDPSTLNLNGDGKVVSVNDISGNNRGLTSISLYGSHLPVPTVNGLSMTGTILKTAPFALNQPEMVYVVFKHGETFNSQRQLFGGNNFDDMSLYINYANTLHNTLAYGGNVLQFVSSYDPQKFILNKVLFNGNGSFLDVNGVRQSGNSGTAAGGGLTIGGLNFDFFGIVSEFIVRKIADTTINEGIITDYLKSKYSL